MTDNINWLGVPRTVKKLNARFADKLIGHEIAYANIGAFQVETVNLGDSTHYLVTHTVENESHTVITRFNFGRALCGRVVSDLAFCPVETLLYNRKLDCGVHDEYVGGCRCCSKGKAKTLYNLLVMFKHIVPVDIEHE